MKKLSEPNYREAVRRKVKAKIRTTDMGIGGKR
jgi:hypothetical protein